MAKKSEHHAQISAMAMALQGAFAKAKTRVSEQSPEGKALDIFRDALLSTLPQSEPEPPKKGEGPRTPFTTWLARHPKPGEQFVDVRNLTAGAYMSAAKWMETKITVTYGNVITGSVKNPTLTPVALITVLDPNAPEASKNDSGTDGGGDGSGDQGSAEGAGAEASP